MEERVLQVVDYLKPGDPLRISRLTALGTKLPAEFVAAIPARDHPVNYQTFGSGTK